MAWKRRSTSTSVDVDLEDFDTEQLLQGLIDGKVISEAEAEMLSKRSSVHAGQLEFSGAVADELTIARQYLHRGNREEAIIHLERFLGREWIGALH
ncbi:hypothetical protein [Ensifer sp. 22564]|uniref:hypothetical protein n=1 Tax=unclassified Ensifer TaxID=2633371 RepID=UPI003F86033C